ncbi:MAG: serine/threonine protein kinase [Oscillospiraceae bacterium]
MLEIGQIIDGKYKILNVIGKGGMSVVYLAMNEKANKQWAIKEVRKDGKQDFDVIKQGLVAEIDILKKLNHPNLPSIIDVIDGDGTFLLVMDYIEGNPLSKKLEEEGAQDQDDVIEWSKQLCDVLNYLHTRTPPIIYRDMKPSNVMLKPDGKVTLIDFGTAREFKSTSVADTTCLGTRGYAAPEQFGGHGQTDARTDIYCLGATMYHLITGQDPSAYPYEMYPIRQWNPLLSSGLEEIILKCTQQNPDQRYQSCAELMYALEHYQELDIENKRQQTLKWKTFIASLILCGVMAFSSLGFKILSNTKTTDTYDSYISSAQRSSGEEAYDYFKKAIELQPASGNAYNKLLEFVLKDNKFDKDESSHIIAATNNIEKFRNGDPEEYAKFCYNLGIAYYFDYRDSDNESDDEESIDGVRQSVTWLENATKDNVLEKNSDTKDMSERAKIISKMAENTSKGAWGESLDNHGDQVKGTSYKDYWDKYVTLTEMDLVNVENAQVALSIYNSFANTIYSHAAEFSKTNLTYSDIEKRFDFIAEKVEEVKKSSTYNEELHSNLASDVLSNIEKAKDAMQRAFNQKGRSADETDIESQVDK